MYADDIVILSQSKKGLQKRIDILKFFCHNWCLELNLSKTKIIIFKKPGKFLKSRFQYDNKVIDCVKNYKYLGISFISSGSSGSFYYAKEELYKKSLKASYNLQKCISSSNPSISTIVHLFDHTIKPILLYGCEITGFFKPDSAACKKQNDYLFEKVYCNDFMEKAHMKFLKYYLGVNIRSSNLAVLSEYNRFPLYFSVILAMLKYLHRLENLKDGLLYQAYMCNKALNSNKTNSWYSCTSYILSKLDIKELNISASILSKLAIKHYAMILLDIGKKTDHKLFKMGMVNRHLF